LRHEELVSPTETAFAKARKISSTASVYCAGMLANSFALNGNCVLTIHNNANPSASPNPHTLAGTVRNRDVSASAVASAPAPTFMQGTGGRILVTIVSAILIWGLFYFALWLDFMPLGLVVIAVCVYFGWGALNKLQDTILHRILIILPLAGWVIFHIVKFILAIIIGVFVAPFVLGKKIGEIYQRRANNQ